MALLRMCGLRSAVQNQSVVSVAFYREYSCAKVNIVRHSWCSLVDKMMEWLEIQSFVVYMGN